MKNKKLILLIGTVLTLSMLMLSSLIAYAVPTGVPPDANRPNAKFNSVEVGTDINVFGRIVNAPSCNMLTDGEVTTFTGNCDAFEECKAAGGDVVIESLGPTFINQTCYQPAEVSHALLIQNQDGAQPVGAALDVEVTSGGAATIGSSTNSATGDYAIAMGSDTKASGARSTAMGRSTTASGNYSTAMGWATKASGVYSTAMGINTTASAYGSTAMGASTTASSSYSTAMGASTTASGYHSTAMGASTTASSSYSTAMGASTTASGKNSTAMGSSTTASGEKSIAMGFETTASGYNSTAMGFYTTASGNNSTAMGFYTKAQPYASTVLGRYNIISGTTDSWEDDEPLFVIGNGDSMTPSNAMTVLKNGNVGIGTTEPDVALDVEVTSSGAATIGSKKNSATGDYAIAMGDETTASGNTSTAMGTATTASGAYSTAMNYDSLASGDYSTAMGDSTKASGEKSTAMGDSTTAQSYASTVLGRYNVISGTTDSWEDDEPLFVIGNGTSTTRSNAMTVLKNGNVGIGTSSPSYDLHVEGSAYVNGSTSLIYMNTYGVTSPFCDYWGSCPANGIGNAITASSSTQNNDSVGIHAGAANSNGYDAVGVYANGYASGGGYGYGIYSAGSLAGGYFKDSVGSTSEVLVAYGGYGILAKGVGSFSGNLSTSSNLYVNNSRIYTNNGDLVFAPNNNNSARFYVTDEGMFTIVGNNGLWLVNSGYAGKPGGGTWTNSSDIRLKDIHGDYVKGLDAIMKLNPVKFNYKADNLKKLPSDKEYIGFIAQEVQPAFPEAISQDTDGYLNFDMHSINVAMVNAIQELKAEKDAEIASLKADNAAMKQVLCQNFPETALCK